MLGTLALYKFLSTFPTFYSLSFDAIYAPLSATVTAQQGVYVKCVVYRGILLITRPFA